MAPELSREPFHQPSSMLTYSYPASFMPDDTSASVCCLITVALMAPAKLFQEFQPIGGFVIGAAPEAADAGRGRQATASPTSNAHARAGSLDITERVRTTVLPFGPRRRSAYWRSAGDG